ncbi:MAG: [LysW]-aminoadipate/[LysW]-glutamate kinase [Candidatus Odinarchaeum yellowstonii]|uniref:Putative [LysW]-aminoadipate/[LysW]-glutamate kinase n=1 Tax=Odinarchaeota yellowstonii (strain LCB_4) TaxID=1841599 RepID=A0AAF0D2P5_ODILC|nr:MAG: [LysW]-aminoadipate/[LysW]-glutamate kinase [Candidatus Odinarchaeum yellowstonii]
MRIVVKIGGELIKSSLENISADTVKVAAENEVIYVHGGAKIVNEISEKLGKKPEFVVSPTGSRSRYTDKETMEIFEMVMAGKANKKVVEALLAKGLKPVGLTGIDGKLIIAERKKVLKVKKDNKIIKIDGGYTGKVDKVDPTLIELLLKNGYIPVIAPIALSYENEPLNIDADRAAANIAGAVKADILIFLTDVDGVLDKDGKIISKIPAESVDNLREQVGFGMEKKILATSEALQMGVRKIVIASGKIDAPITNALTGERRTVIAYE